jgi:23S rRNA pseudouridine2605 synthase
LSPERLQKVLAAAGIASRRDCEELIREGRVAINGKVIRILGARVDPERDEITLDGKPIQQAKLRSYAMLNKPAGVVSTAEDTHGRPTVVDLVPSEARLFPVGRLDMDSEGLIILTDDGALTQRLTHPSFAIEKEYRVLLDQAPSTEAIRQWREGVELDGEMTAPAVVSLLEKTDEGAWVRVVLHEGRKRQIREVAKLLGYEVLRLIRVREGPLELGDLPSGQWRSLTDEEVEALWQHAGGRPGEGERDGAECAPGAAVAGGIAAADRPRRAPRRDDRPRREEYGRDRSRREDVAGGARYTDRPRDDRPRREGYGNERPRYDDRPRREGYGNERPRYDDWRRREGSYSDRPPRDGGYGPRRQGYGTSRFDERPRREGYNDRPPREGAYGPHREGYGNDRPRDDDRSRRYDDRPPRASGYGPRREGYGSSRYDERPRYGDRPRDDRPRREGYGNDRPPREGAYGPRREGYGNDRPRDDDRPRRYDDRPRREGYGNDRPPRASGFGPRREGYGNDRPHDDDRPRREGYGTSRYNDRPPRRDAGDDRRPPRRQDGPPRPRREPDEGDE